MTSRQKWLTALVFAGMAAFFIAATGRTGFWDHSESRYAAIAAAMVRSGDWFTPHLFGVPYLEKPPLSYWLTATSFSVLGLTEFAGRLPLAVCALAGAGAIFLLGWRRIGWKTGLLAAIVLSVSPEYFASARFLATDMSLACFMTLSLTSFFLATTSEKKWLYPLFYVFAALATMSKGIVGIFLPTAIVGVYILLTRQWHLLREMRPALGTLIFLCIATPWFILMQSRYPQFYHFFVVEQHFQRFLSPNAVHNHSMAYFIPVLFGGFFPWSLMLPAALWRRHVQGAGQENLHLFLWVWFAVVFVFFSISSGKLASYILPAFPPVALLVAHLWTGCSDKNAGVTTCRGLRLMASLTAVVLLVTAAAMLIFGPEYVLEDARVPLHEVKWLFTTGALAMAAGSLGLLLLAARRKGLLMVYLLSGVNVLVLFLMVAATNIIAPYTNAKPVIEAVMKRLRPGDRVAIYSAHVYSLEVYLPCQPMIINGPGELNFGRQLKPDPQRFYDEPEELKDVLALPETVYCFTRKKQFLRLPEDIRTSVRIVAENAKWVTFRNRGHLSAKTGTVPSDESAPSLRRDPRPLH
jgi:4-amino-4-deoxy-L-arabinose transferase-like glycosyltransferase